jgi:hypothetical protein
MRFIKHEKHRPSDRKIDIDWYTRIAPYLTPLKDPLTPILIYIKHT